MAPVTAGSSGDARQNGNGRDRSASVTLAATSAAYHSGPGVQSPVSRAAITVTGSAAAWATARTTSVCDTPVRNSPVSSLNSVNRSHRVSSPIQAPTCAC